MLWLALVGWAAAAAPSDQTLVYYNARMALREGNPVEAVKLWLLRNSIEDQTGRVSPHDADFGSVTWAALGQTGVCPDGHPDDTDGAGLWPLALHNHVVRSMGRRGRNRGPRTFDAFEVGRQARKVSIGEVLGADELRTVELVRGPCLRPRLALAAAGLNPLAPLSDREVSAKLLQHLLFRSNATLDHDTVRGRAAIHARLFDLDLQLTALAERKARQRARDLSRLGRSLGLGRRSVQDLTDRADPTTLKPDSRAARILRDAATWPVSEWMSLSPDRRLFLFDQARAYAKQDARFDAISLGVLDGVVAEGRGEEVEPWIARAVLGGDRAAVWAGARGQRLLALDPASGFRERSVLALHQGVGRLEQGDLPGALESFAWALNHAPESRVSDEVAGLARRWLGYVAARFVITDGLLDTLQAMLPRRDYAALLEDLMWRAAFHADATSFERGVGAQPGKGALDRRLALLRPLAQGDVTRFALGIRTSLRAAPSETMRFLEQLVQRLEREDADVRGDHRPTLVALQALLEPLVSESGGAGRRGRLATDLSQRVEGILVGLDGVPVDPARARAPEGDVFVGAVRLAPSDPLPWPFAVAAAAAPSVFTPLTLTPVEWRDEADELVFGWEFDG